MKKQSTILVTSPQGGSGKSTIALNTALHFANMNMKVLLIDMACYGSLPSMLKIPIRGKGMSSLITALEQNEGKIHPEQFSSYFRDSLMVYEGEKNLHLLLSASPLKMEKLTIGYVQAIIQAARMEHYSAIIIDTSSELCERNIGCLEQADCILIPTLQDVTSGWKTILFKEILESLNIDRDKISVIVNRCTKYSGFNNLEYRDELGYSLLAEIQDVSKKAQKHINNGVPIVNSGNKRAAMPFRNLSNQLLKKLGG
ncbi:AAA family ATPase [Paenibacillus koleovorans]|uniref:AAA family ATPase n=1 Tax=Paenibacillus koleovorans TaxID=121608 RepID=UPI000FDA8493|nr:AAA family ATPase [Paenibacillus koleovorans]